MRANKLNRLLEQMGAKKPDEYKITIPLNPSIERDIIEYRESIPELAFHPDLDPGKKYIPHITAFKDFPPENISDVIMMLDGFGEIECKVYMIPQYFRNKNVDIVYLPVASQGCIYVAHMLSRFFERLPEFKNYIPHVSIGYLIPNMAPLAIDPGGTGHRDFTAVELNITKNGKPINTIPLRAGPQPDFSQLPRPQQVFSQ